MNTPTPTSKRILVVTPTYSTDGSSRWLPEELARELASRGHEVRVVARDMITARPLGPQPRQPGEPDVFSIGVTSDPHTRWRRRVRLPIALVRQRLLAIPWAKQSSYDSVIYFTIAWTNSSVVRALRRSGKSKQSVLVLWDFFPVHQYAIGHISRWLAPLQLVFYALESRAVKAATVVAVMSEAGANFLRKYFPVFGGGTIILPPWGEDSDVRVSLPARFRAVFGGQLGAGRGVEDILRAAEILKERGSGITFSIFGDGPLAPWIHAEIQRRSLSNVSFEGQLPRDQYLQQVAQSSVGIAATVRGVPSPSFPSKIVDYARVGLPIIASVEDSTDVGQILSSRGVGWTARAGYPEELVDALLRAEEAHGDGRLSEFSARSRKFFEQELDVRATADKLLGLL